METFRDLGVSEALAAVLADKNIKEPRDTGRRAGPDV